MQGEEKAEGREAYVTLKETGKDLIKEDSFTTFTIWLYDHTIKVSRGEIPGERVFLEWTDIYYNMS